MWDIKPQIQEAQKTPTRITQKRNKILKNTWHTTPRHIIFKLQKIKDKEKEKNTLELCTLQKYLSKVKEK